MSYPRPSYDQWPSQEATEERPHIWSSWRSELAGDAWVGSNHRLASLNRWFPPLNRYVDYLSDSTDIDNWYKWIYIVNVKILISYLVICLKYWVGLGILKISTSQTEMENPPIWSVPKFNSGLLLSIINRVFLNLSQNREPQNPIVMFKSYSKYD